MRFFFCSSLPFFSTAACVGALSTSSAAQDAGGDGSVAGDLSVTASSAAGTASASDGAFRAGIEPGDPRYYETTGMEPAGNLLELGIFGGLFFASPNHAFNEFVNPYRPEQDLKRPSPEFGVRIGYYPASFLGVELEGMGAAGVTESGRGATLYAGRAHMVLQLMTPRVAPFALVGGGRIGVRGDATGNDDDPALHFGAGLKIFPHPRVVLRAEFRDSITKQRPDDDTAHHLEALLGAGIVFGRPDPVPRNTDGDALLDIDDKCPREPSDQPDGCPIRDADGDTFLDDADACPGEPGVAPDGCPVRDVDQDGVLDEQDQCPQTPGIAPTGCPDGDNDGVLDRDDKCLQEPGVAPDGCPPDTDGDGLLDRDDKCPTEPETKNGFEDKDGCPDTVPEVVKKFSGVIPGIRFASNRAEITQGSRPVLDEAAGVLNKYPTLRIMVVGHTDASGSHDHNVDLSRRRAEAVRKYLIDRSVEPERIMTRGEGPDDPIADNKTAAGRAKNRRIEFKIIE